MSQGIATPRSWMQQIWQAWEYFWFSPEDPATLGLIRILAGTMLFYTHAVWSLELTAFFGPDGWLSNDFAYRFHDSQFGWSHLYWISSPTTLWVTHILALAVFASLALGFRTRFASITSYLLTVSYAHRAGGALFGLDQINGFLALYLAVGPSGDAWSVDNWLRRRHGQSLPGPSISANLAIRLMQLHLCLVYLFAGIGKLFGESWWDGTALWGAFANHEYQTFDMTWLAKSLVLINIMTHTTLFWEVTYAALIWPRLTRPVMLLLAVPLHMGIALCMGMTTFGLMMLVANLAFVSPELIHSLQAKCFARVHLRQKSPGQASPRHARPVRQQQPIH